MSKFMMSLLVTLLLTTAAQAQWSNKGIKFQAKIKYTASGELLNQSGASVNVRILSPNNCVLWEENHPNQNIVNGYLSLVVGSGTTQGAHPVGTTLKAVFDNTTNRTGLVCVDANNGTTADTIYHPTPNDTRKVRIYFVNGSDNILADFSLRASGYALNSETLDGKVVNDFILKAATSWPATCASGEFVSSVSATGAVTCSPVGSVGSVTSVAGRTGAVTLSTADISGLGSAALLGVGTTAGTVASGNDARFAQINGVAVSATAPTANQVLQFNGTQYVPVALPSAPVSSVSGRTGAVTLTTSDIFGLGGASVLNVGTTTGTVAAGDDARFTKLNGVTVSATAPSVNGQVLTWNSATSQWEAAALPATSVPVTSVAGRTGAIVLSNTDISGLGGAAVLNVGTTTGTVAAGDDLRFTKINGVAVSSTAPTTNQVLQYNGTQYVPVALPSAPVTTVAGRTGAIVLSQSDISGLGDSATLNVGTAVGTVAAGDDSRITGALQSSAFNAYVGSASCTSSQSMYWNSVSSQFLCQNITVASSTNFSGSLAGDVTGTQGATAVVKIRGVAVSATAPTANQVLQYDGSQYVPAALPAAPVSSVAGRTGAIVLSQSDISGLGGAAVLNVGTAAGTVAAGNDSRITGAFQASTALAGDLTGTLASVTVAKIRGVAVSATAPTSNQVLQYNGTQYVPATLPIAPVTTVAGRTGAIVLTNADVSGLGGAAVLNVGTAAGTVAAGDDARFTKINGVAVSSTAPTTNQVLQYNGTQYVPVALPSAPVTTVAGRTGAIVLSQSDISGLGGAALLNVGTAAGSVAAGNDSRITGALQSSTFNSAVASANCMASQTMYWNSVSSQFLCQAISVVSSTNFSGSLAGDVTGTQSATVVEKIRGVAVSATAPTANQVLQYDGSQYVPVNLPSAPVTTVAGKTGAVTLDNTDISGLGDSATLNVGSAAGTVAAGNDPRFLPAGTNAGDMLIYNGSTWTSDPFITRRMSRKITDFSGTTLPAGLTASASIGSCTFNTVYAGYFGAARCGTSTSSTGWVSVNNGTSELKTGKAIFHKQTVVIPVLSVAAQRFNIRAGISSAGTTGNADPAAGAYIRYSDNVNSGRFQCVSRNASVETSVDSGVTVVAGTIYELEVRINAAANQVSCFVNGVAAGTITTNVPATSNSMGIISNIQKTVGTTASNLDILDWETVIVK